jgi:hypothetical protein
MVNPWLTLGLKAFDSELEAQSVIALRMLRMSTGGTHAKTEVHRMLTKKVLAAGEAQAAAAAAILRGHMKHVATAKALHV